MSAINFGRPKRTSSNDSVRKLEESMESDDNHSLSGREERVLGLGLEPELDTTPTNEVGVYRRLGRQSRFSLGHRSLLESEGKLPKRSFCRSWCEMWFLLARSKLTCVGISLLLLGSGLLLIFLTTFGGLMECPTLNGAVVFCFLVSILSLTLGLLCCCYHWVKDDDDLPFAIFCVAYCLLLLFIFITVAGTVVVFTRIHPIGSDQPPPGVPLPHQNSSAVLKAGVEDCQMVELPLGVLVVCYFLAIGFVLMSYIACILALGATSDIPPL